MKGGDLNFGASGKPRDGVGSHVTSREAGPPSPLQQSNAFESTLLSSSSCGPAKEQLPKPDLFGAPSPAPLNPHAFIGRLALEAGFDQTQIDPQLVEAARTLAPACVGPRVAIGIDGADTTGVALWRCIPRAPSSRLPTAPQTFAKSGFISAHVVKIKAARWMEEDSIVLLDELLGPEAEWIAAVERPFGIRKVAGKVRGAPPSHGEKYWRRVLEHLARRRAERKGVQHRKPLILRPRPQDWRSTIGVATQGDVKGAAIAFLRNVFGLVIPQPDAAEAACIAHYASRVANLPALPKKGGSIPMRFTA